MSVLSETNTAPELNLQGYAPNKSPVLYTSEDQPVLLNFVLSDVDAGTGAMEMNLTASNGLPRRCPCLIFLPHPESAPAWEGLPCSVCGAPSEEVKVRLTRCTASTHLRVCQCPTGSL